MSAEQIRSVLESFINGGSWGELDALIEQHPALLTPGVEAPLDYMIDAARRDGDETRAFALTTLKETLVAARKLGPQTALAALREPGEARSGDAGHEFFDLYRQTGDAGALDAAIEQWEAQLELTPPDSPDRPAALTNVATGRSARFQRTHTGADLQRAVACSQDAVQLTPAGAPERGTRLSNWAGALLERYGSEHHDSDLDTAIAALSEALESSTERALCLHNYAGAVYERYARTRDPADLGAMVDAAQEAVALTEPGSITYAERQDTLAVALERRYLDERDERALDLALDAWTEALEQRGGAPVSAPLLFAAGRGHWRRLQLSGRPQDRAAAAELLTYAYLYGSDQARALLEPLLAGDAELDTLLATLEATLEHAQQAPERDAMFVLVRGWTLALAQPALGPQHADRRAEVLAAAGTAYSLVYQFSRDAYDLDQTLAVFDEALALTPSGSPLLRVRQGNVGRVLRERYGFTSDPSDLARAIELLEAAADGVGRDDPDFPRVAGNLAGALLMGTPDVPALERARALLDAAAGVAPAGSSRRASTLLSRSGAELELFRRTRDAARLDAAIATLEQLPTGPLTDERRRRAVLLSRCLLERFELHAGDADLDRSIELLEQALDVDPENPELLTELGTVRVLRGELRERRGDIERGAEALRTAVALTAPNAPERAEREAALAGAEAAGGDRQAVARLQAALEQVGADSPRRAVLSTVLERALLAQEDPATLDAALARDAEDGHLLLARYQRDRRREDLDAAVRAFESEPRGNDADDAQRLTRLGVALAERHRLDAAPADHERAVAAFRRACELTREVSPGRALDAAMPWAQLEASLHDWKAAKEPYELGLDALARLLEAPALREEREDWLADARGFAAQAAYGLAFAQDSRAAIVAVERNRALLLTEVLQRERLDLGLLRAAGREALADRYTYAVERLRELDAAELKPSGAPRPARSSPADEIAGARERLAAVMREIRTVPGCEALFDAPGFDDIVEFAGDVPLIYLFAGPEWGLALVVAESAPPPVILPHLTSQREAQWVNAYLSAYAARADAPAAWRAWLDHTLQWLGGAALEPLLNALSDSFTELYLRGASSVVLVPIGPLALLPLHAAWMPEGEHRRYAMDRLCISYAPNARVLAQARQSRDAGRASMLVIEDPQPVTARPLPGAAAETAAARRAFPGAQILAGDQATPSAVMDALAECGNAHFACHGYADPDEPLDSFLLLAGDQRLRLRDLLASRIPGLRLAVLSACETGVVGRELPDEVIGLPTGLLQAGASGVVASSWAVPDHSTALLLTRFYDVLGERGPAEALREAQQWMRDTTNGEKLALMPELMEPRVPAATAARGLWERARGHRHPYEWAGFSYVGA